MTCGSWGGCDYKVAPARELGACDTDKGFAGAIDGKEILFLGLECSVRDSECTHIAEGSDSES